MEPKRVVIVGGGIAGVVVAKHLESEASVTLIDPKDYLEIPYGELRCIVEPSFAERSTVLYSQILPQTKHIMSSAVSASTTEVKTSGGENITFDYLVVCTGSTPKPAWETRDQRLQHFKSENQRLKLANNVLIIGGGPVGVELAGEIVTDYPEKKITLVQAGDRLIEFLSPAASTKALNWLKSKSVDVILNDRVDLSRSSPPTYWTQSGRKIQADEHFLCIGRKLSNSWLKNSFLAGSLNEEGRLEVDSSLRVVGTENVFGAGDITDIKEIKQGFLAENHAKIVAANIKNLMQLSKPGCKHKCEGAGSKKYNRLESPMGLVSLGRNAGIMDLPIVGARVGWIPGLFKSKDLFVGKTRKGLGLKD